MRNTFVELLCQFAANDETVWLLTADLGFSILEPFAERFPERYVNVGVAEQNMIGIAAGLAMSGLTPFAYSITNFATLRCLEQIRNDVCYHQAAVTIVGVGAGFSYGSQGYTHHGLENLAILSMLPHIDVLAPADTAELRSALPILKDARRPSYLHLGKSNEATVHGTPPNLRRGQLVCCREGRDLAIIATGSMVAISEAAADLLVPQGISAAVYSAPWVRPLDHDEISNLGSCYPIVATAEEGVVGGLGATVGRILAEAASGVRLVCFGIREGAIAPTLSQSAARHHFGLDAESMAGRIAAILS